MVMKKNKQDILIGDLVTDRYDGLTMKDYDLDYVDIGLVLDIHESPPHYDDYCEEYFDVHYRELNPANLWEIETLWYLVYIPSEGQNVWIPVNQLKKIEDD